MRHILPPPKKHLIGHRGVAGLRPENTLCSFRYAAELGINWIEFDVQLSKDNVWMVMHDDTLDRTTNAHGLVKDYSAQELTTFNAGLWFKPPYPDQKIPTLLETIQLANELDLFCNIEVKVVDNATDLYVEQFKKFASTHMPLLQDKCVVSSFDLNCAMQLTEDLSELPVALLIEEWQPNIVQVFNKYNFASLNCDVSHFHLEALSVLQTEAIPVFLYTVNDPLTAKHWLKQGVAGFFTDRPDLLTSI